MKKHLTINLVVLMVLFAICSIVSAEELTKEEIIQKLHEIFAIENDIARLETYDQFVASLGANTSNFSSISNNIVAEYSGNGMKNTRPFKVNGPWEIQWDAKGDIFQIFLFSGDGQLIDIAANQQGPGKGSYYSPKVGEYYLQVNALGNWEIKIVHVK
ncbi:MAG: hypothetical protein PWR10_1832 [Halanaerobiales bacterium]|nr:hypothetical protein [Halanaerobiales bacterium]